MAERLHGEIAADYTDMICGHIYAATRVEIEGCRKAFILPTTSDQICVRHAISAKDVSGRLKPLKHITAKERVRPLARSFGLDA
jgi:hypothetical protein